MRLASWLDQFAARPPRQSRGRLWRRSLRCRLAEVELLEDRTLLTPMIYAATDLPLLVPPDGSDSTGTTVSMIHVADDFVVRDVNVQLNIERTSDADLLMVLIAPDGTRVELISGIGGAGDNFTDTVLDQQSALSIADALAPFTGTFRPITNLSIFNDQQALGDWTLEITDTAFGDAGSLLTWSLTLDDTTPVILESSPDAVLKPTLTPGIYSLKVAQTGAVTISLSAADGSLFVGDVALLTSDLRPLAERSFQNETGTDSAKFTELVDLNDYLLRVQSRTLSSAAPRLQTQFVPVSNPVLPIPAENRPIAVQVADVNGDGRVDLITANEVFGSVGVGYVSVLVGHGDGTFETEANYEVRNPLALVVVDVDRDGYVDLVTVSDEISVLLGRGDGTFEDERRFAVGLGPQTVRVADLNGDGNIDLVTSNYDSGDVSVLLGRGDGTFEEQRRFAVGLGPRTVQVVDVNRDGRVDLVTPNSGTTVSDVNTGFGHSVFGTDVSVLLGHGDGTFEVERRFAVGLEPQMVQVVDVNADGRVDVVTANRASDDVSVLLGQQDGTFADQYRFAVGFSPGSVQVADLNDDGRMDLVTTNENSADVSVLLGRGDGTFEDEYRFEVGFTPIILQVEDVNGDGHADLVVLPNSGVTVLLGRGDGMFEAPIRLAAGEYPVSVQVADLNNDGRVDLVTANAASSNVSVLLGCGDGEFESQRRSNAVFRPNTVQAVDVNGDDHIDLLTSSFDSTDVSVLLGRGDGTFEWSNQHRPQGQAMMTIAIKLKPDFRRR